MASSPVARAQLLVGAEAAQPRPMLLPRPRSIMGILPAPVVIFLSIVSAQIGGATAKTLLATHPALSIVLLRTGFAAGVLWLMAPPRMREYSKRQWWNAVLLGLAIAVLNLGFYLSISRIALGITITIEFLGPFTVALAASRQAKELVWPILAFGGILLLSPAGNLKSLSLAGMAFALLAAAAWAAYLILAKQITTAFSGASGLTLPMTFSFIAILPFAVLSGGKSLFDFSLLVNGFWISLLSTIVPFTLEFLALKRMSSRTFGILLSGEPAVAALVGLLMLHEQLALRAWAALALVSIAILGVMALDKDKDKDKGKDKDKDKNKNEKSHSVLPNAVTQVSIS
jgi:inner membrane transporter RhtA